jgi:aryl-alcohol dehydrogenase-like predicted oxidoreductase
MKLALGTVQFGMDYGVANTSGCVSYGEVKNILKRAQSLGIDTLDTAVAYGNSEEILGQSGIRNWKLVTKLPKVPHDCFSVREWVDKQVRQSMIRLGTSQLYGVLLHSPAQLFEPIGPDLYDALRTINVYGLTQKIGISVYTTSELSSLLDAYTFDLVQLPLNILDRRFEEAGLINRLHDKHIEVHVRSVFLQGLLLMPSEQRPEKFRRWSDIWETWDDWLVDESLTPLEACMRYINNLPQIDKVVVGVCNVHQLEQLIEASKGKLNSLPEFKSLKDAQLINPTYWSQL